MKNRLFLLVSLVLFGSHALAQAEVGEFYLGSVCSNPIDAIGDREWTTMLKWKTKDPSDGDAKSLLLGISKEKSRLDSLVNATTGEPIKSETDFRGSARQQGGLMPGSPIVLRIRRTQAPGEPPVVARVEGSFLATYGEGVVKHPVNVPVAEGATFQVAGNTFKVSQIQPGKEPSLKLDISGDGKFIRGIRQKTENGEWKRIVLLELAKDNPEGQSFVRLTLWPVEMEVKIDLEFEVVERKIEREVPFHCVVPIGPVFPDQATHASPGWWGMSRSIDSEGKEFWEHEWSGELGTVPGEELLSLRHKDLRIDDCRYTDSGATRKLTLLPGPDSGELVFSYSEAIGSQPGFVDASGSVPALYMEKSSRHEVKFRLEKGAKFRVRDLTFHVQDARRSGASTILRIARPGTWLEVRRVQFKDSNGGEIPARSFHEAETPSLGPDWLAGSYQLDGHPEEVTAIFTLLDKVSMTDLSFRVLLPVGVSE